MSLEKKTQQKTLSDSTVPIRVRKSTSKLITSLVKKANQKKMGRRIKSDDLIALLLTKMTTEDLETLKDLSLSNADRLEKQYRDFVKNNGSIKKDEFIGILLSSSHEQRKVIDE